MGLTFVDAEVSGPQGSAEVKLLVDSGATYTVLPQDVWQRLGLESKRRIVMRLADGTDLRRDVGECRVRLEFGEINTPVILGGPTDLPLLGSITLEELGLVLDPFSRTLHPMRVLLPTIITTTGWEPEGQ